MIRARRDSRVLCSATLQGGRVSVASRCQNRTPPGLPDENIGTQKPRKTSATKPKFKNAGETPAVQRKGAALLCGAFFFGYGFCLQE